MLNGSGTGLSEGTTDPVTLTVLSWNVVGLSEDSTDLLSVADFDAHSVGYFVAAGMSQELDGVNVGAHELFTPSELVGGLRCSAVVRDGTDR